MARRPTLKLVALESRFNCYFAEMNKQAGEAVEMTGFTLTRLKARAPNLPNGKECSDNDCR